jgi:hypothetical protein
MNNECKVRQDLIDSNLAVPIDYHGNGISESAYLQDKKGKYEYRWNKEKFQIFIDGRWWNASSTDFEF